MQYSLHTSWPHCRTQNSFATARRINQFQKSKITIVLSHTAFPNTQESMLRLCNTKKHKVARAQARVPAIRAISHSQIRVQPRVGGDARYHQYAAPYSLLHPDAPAPPAASTICCFLSVCHWHAKHVAWGQLLWDNRVNAVFSGARAALRPPAVSDEHRASHSDRWRARIL